MRIVGIGGSARDGSGTEELVRAVLGAVENTGVHRTRMFSGTALAAFPIYGHGSAPTREVKAFVECVRAADAVVIGSPSYHGSVSGLVKNAIDHLEELRADARPYLDGRPVGLLSTARGQQAAVNTLNVLRDITHALRGWPTPLGIAVDTSRTSVESYSAGPMKARVSQLALQLSSFRVEPAAQPPPRH
ncbi:NADPH-dependent FMN reductase [Nocardiopsis sp. YSL2]|uniref:NADPH-dependent FMN reductase n=1 Tax=Nocardiopsis sp. YSL2 TaxID=2939492 RepID=UPI0026F47831|nr:NADPH-dependent FMN reductase [Nocardiopsis sp. YSL2]